MLTEAECSVSTSSGRSGRNLTGLGMCRRVNDVAVFVDVVPVLDELRIGVLRGRSIRYRRNGYSSEGQPKTNPGK
jgi:hypothetical protein